MKIQPSSNHRFNKVVTRSRSLDMRQQGAMLDEAVEDNGENKTLKGRKEGVQKEAEKCKV